MAIAALNLLNFRNHVNLELGDFCHSNNFIIGPNGSGKTNILEAISLLAPGRGLRSAKGAEIFTNTGGEIYPNWAAHFEIADNTYHISCAFNNGRESKLIKLDQQPLRGSNKLLECLRVVWLTPQMCHLFIQGALERRKFLDRIVYNHIPSHADLLNNYTKLVRSRMHLLKEKSYDPTWIATLEEQIAESALEVISSRVQIVKRLQAQLSSYDWDWKPEVALELSYDPEENGWEVEAYQKRLAENRSRDGLIGRTSIGPHRDDVNFIHSVKKMPGRFCSTGEQKNAVIKLVLAHLAGLQDECEMPIILLLDDIFAHIDDYNKEIILGSLNDAKSVQKWITATPDDLTFASDMASGAKVVEL